MSGESWLHEKGAEGTVGIYRSDEGGIGVHTDAFNRQVTLSLMGVDGIEPQLAYDTTTKVRIRIRTVVYDDDGSARLFAELIDAGDLDMDNSEEQSGAEATPQSNEGRHRSNRDTADRRTLAQLQGDNRRTVMTVWVDEVSGSRAESVLQRGKLADHSTMKMSPFVTFGEDRSKRLQPRKRYRLSNVKDGHYEAKGHNQVVIDQRSSIEELDASGEHPKSMVEKRFDQDITEEEAKRQAEYEP